MKWLSMVGYVLWRALVSGAIEGALLGTLIIPLAGTIYGFVYGLFIGGALGLLNAVSLAVMTRVFFDQSLHRSAFIACVMLVAIPLDVLLVMQWLGSWLGVVTAVLVAVTAAYYSFGYADYVRAQLDKVEPRTAAVKVLS